MCCHTQLFHTGTGDLNSGLHYACTTGTLLTEPSHVLKCCLFGVSFYVVLTPLLSSSFSVNAPDLIKTMDADKGCSLLCLKLTQKQFVLEVLFVPRTWAIVYRFWPSLLAVCGMSPAHGHHHLCFINKETRFREVATGDFSGCCIQQVGHSLISDSKYQVLCVPPLSWVGSPGPYQGVPIILPPLLHSPIRGVLGKQAWFLSGQRMISGPSSLFYVLRGNSLWLSQGAMVLGTVIKGGYCACLLSWSCNSVLAVDTREFYVTNLMSFSRTSKGF